MSCDYEKLVWKIGKRDWIWNHSLSALRWRYFYRWLKFDDRKRKIILDVGCGTGWLMELIAKNLDNCIVYGIDISFNALKENPFKGRIAVADAQDMPLKDRSVDIVICSDVLEHLNDMKRALREIYRVLKPDGKLLIFFPADFQKPYMFWLARKLGLPYKLKLEQVGHIQMLSVKEFFSQLRDEGFIIDEYYYSYHFLGSLLDYLSYAIKPLRPTDHERNAYRSSILILLRTVTLARFLQLILGKLFERMIYLLSPLAYIESILLRKVVGAGVHLIAHKNETRNEQNQR
jgi:SAM-dependent methyltransferase